MESTEVLEGEGHPMHEAKAIMTLLAALLLATDPACAQRARNWKTLEADNGAVFEIDLNSIDYFNDGKAMAITCRVDNNSCSPANMARLMFDCRGHYTDVDGGGDYMPAPPKSIVGRMAELACAKAKDTRFTSTQSPQIAATKSSGVIFRECLDTQGRSGSYTTAGSAFEAAKSVTGLLGQCKTQWDVWQNECIAKGGPNGDLGGCAGRAYRTAYEVLQTLGK